MAKNAPRRAVLSNSCGCGENECCKRAKEFIAASDWSGLFKHWQNTLEINNLHLALYLDVYGPRDRGRPRTKSRPKDYTPCPECGYDHAYDSARAAEWHMQCPSLFK